MICISVAPESRKLAKVDLLNAASQGEMIELCLDHLVKQPDVGDLLTGVTEPVIVSCRRQQDGGRWEGTEEDRRALLRQAIAAGPDFVELDLAAARCIGRYGETKRIVSHAGRDDTAAGIEAADIDEIVEQARGADADYVKLICETPTLESMHRLVEAIARPRALPIVVTGIGDCSTAVALVARKYRLSWVDAALEKGMEAHDGQPTVADLKGIYDFESINGQTKFVGMVGLESAEAVTVRVINSAFQLLELNLRCLPFELSQFDHLAAILRQLRVKSLLIGPKWGKPIMQFADRAVGSAEPCQFADLLLRQKHAWEAYNTIWRHSLYATEEAIGKKSKKDMPLARKSVLLIGANGLARAIAHGVERRKGTCSVAAADDVAARRVAQMFNIRHVPFANLYDTLADAVIFTDPAIQLGPGKTQFNPSYLRSNMTVADLSQLPNETDILGEARYRGANVVEPKAIYAAYLRAQFESLTGKKLPDEAMQGILIDGE